MRTVIIDYNSGNLRSAEKSFARMAAERGAGSVCVSSQPDEVLSADRLVLPGVGAFADCRAGLASIDGLFEALEQAVLHRGTPFLGICVGMQMMASIGREHELDTKGFDWIGGEVVRITPDDDSLKIPHMGWNELSIEREHPLLADLPPAPHAYFVHSYQFVPNEPACRLACCSYGGQISAVIGRDNMVGTQFHPEKSQATGLKLIANFLDWKP